MQILRLELIYINNVKTYNVSMPLTLILMSSVIEYRTIGININSTPPPDVKKDAEKIQGVSKEFMEKEFPDYYQNKSSNIALQCQNLINIYGKRGWEHYFQGQIGNLILFYFKRNVESVKNQIDYKLTPSEESLIQSLDESQRP
tara:strand:- start:93 stop:524 length:432 start_codon:yes stop_codon:yes gene_type:complete